jgi:hypothetical protein
MEKGKLKVVKNGENGITPDDNLVQHPEEDKIG